jgi:DNA-binding NtrC family response regulator
MRNVIIEQAKERLSPECDADRRGGMGVGAGEVAPFAFVIDDQAEICRLVATTLATLGIECDAFPSAKPAIASLDRRRPAVIFLDVALEQSDAIDVIKGLSDKNYAGTVQLMSGSRPSLLEAIQRIAQRYGLTLCVPLQKPVTPDAVRAVAESLGLARDVKVVLD